MDPLAVVEGELSSADTSSSSLLADMICKEPTVSVSRRVAAFLYRNGICVKDVAKLYWACQAAWRNV